MHMIRCFWCSQYTEFKYKDQRPKKCFHCNKPLSDSLEEHMERVKKQDEKAKKTRLANKGI